MAGDMGRFTAESRLDRHGRSSHHREHGTVHSVAWTITTGPPRGGSQREPAWTATIGDMGRFTASLGPSLQAHLGAVHSEGVAETATESGGHVE